MKKKAGCFLTKTINIIYENTSTFFIYIFSKFKERNSAATRKYIMMGQKYFKGGGEKERLERREKYTKNIKINNSENFRGARLLPGGFHFPWPPLVAGLERNG